MLIDSEKLTARYCKAHCGHHAEVCGNPCETVRFIREEPEAVVRCEECRMWHKPNCPMSVLRDWPSFDCYCASGRRKEDNNDKR